MKDERLQRILILRFSSIGDIILTTPLIRAVRARFPEARLDFVTKREFSELLDTNPRLNTVYAYDTRSGSRGLRHLARELRHAHYTLCIDLHHSLRSRYLRALLHAPRVVSISKQILARTLLVSTGLNFYTKPLLQIPERYLLPLAPFGVRPDDKGPELFPSEEQYAKIRRILKEEHAGPETLLIGFGPIAAHPLKQWPLEKFAELGRRLIHDYQARIVIFGAPSEQQAGEKLAGQLSHKPILLSGRLSLLESAAALKSCALFVGNDSSGVHMASAMQTPLVALFGPTVEEFGFSPYRVPSQVISVPLSCRPCTHTGKGRCRNPEQHACMKRIRVQDVEHAVAALLGQ